MYLGIVEAVGEFSILAKQFVKHLGRATVFRFNKVLKSGQCQHGLSLPQHKSKPGLSSYSCAVWLGFALTIVIQQVSPTSAWAGYWTSYTNPMCGGGGGTACAQSDFDNYWRTDPAIERLGCQLDYNDAGLLIGASCKGRSGGAFRGGNATYACDSGEYPSMTGCVASPPPDLDPNCSTSAGNPVDVRSGTKIQSRVDFSTDGQSPLKFERFYSGVKTSNAGPAIPSRLGLGWRSTFDSSIYVGNASTADNWVSVTLPSAEVFYFNYTSATNVYAQSYLMWQWNGHYVGTRGRVASLEKDPVSLIYKLTTDDGVVRTYGSDGKLKSIIQQNGYSQTLTYDTNGYNTLVTDSFGRTLQFSYTVDGTLSSMTVPGGQVYLFSYLPLPGTSISTWSSVSLGPNVSVLEYVIQPDSTPATSDNPRIRYHYENTTLPFVLTGITNEAGVRYATWTYGNDGRVLTSEHAGGVEHYAFSYDDSANTVTVTNPLSKVSVYHMSKDDRGNNRLTQLEGQASTNCVASNSSIAYDTNNFVTDQTDAEGRVTHYVRDSRGNPTSITRGYGTPSAQSTTYTWHASLNVPTQVVEPGLTTNYTWTSGRLTQLTQLDTTSQTVPYSTNGQTRTWTFVYGTGGLLTSIDGPLAGSGDTVLYAYNSNGFVSTSTNEIGQVTTVTAWTGRGQPTSITDPNGVVSNLTYDSEGRFKSMIVDPSGLASTMTLDYNAIGDVIKVTRPNGGYLQYAYDNGRRIINVQDNLGNVIQYDRDNLGNATAQRIKDAGANVLLTQTAVFDELGRLLKFVGASSQTWTHAYDKTDNRVSVTDPRSNVFGWSFDALNRLIKTTGEETNVVTLTRNGKDEITNYSDPRSLNTSFVRSGFGDVIQRSSPDTGSTVYTYNALSKPTQITDGRAVVTNLTYDNAGRLLTKQYPAATTENITYTWDATTSSNKGKGRVTKIQDASGSIEWVYNALGQVAQEKKTTGTAIYTIGYAYDLDGNVTQITYPSGRIVSYSRGATGLVTGVTTKATSSASVVSLAGGVNYQPFGPLQSLTYGNGLILWKVFNQDYGIDVQLVEQGSTSIMNRAHGRWNNDFDITNVWDNNVSARSENYVYTPSHRLQNAYGDWGTLTYYQDGVGNRTADIFDNGSTTTSKSLAYAYNNNLLQGFLQGSTVLRTFAYDGAGNIITDTRGSTAYNYRYNKRGRLDRLTVGTTVKADYSYDGLERMAVRTTQNMTPSGTTHYVYDRAGRLLAESTGTGGTQREYVWINDMPLAIVADIDTSTPKLWYVHPDHLDRPVKMTDVNKMVVWDAWYWPYGETRSITGTASNNLRFPGQYFLVESGLHYNWHRHYDPTTGRYIQADPNRDIIMTRPVNLDGFALISRSGRTGGAQLAPVVASSGDFNSKIGSELPEFVDGPSVYQYARSAPGIWMDPKGLDATVWRPGSGPTNGNWGGLCWSGGQYSCGSSNMGTAPPTDSADVCYKGHDQCYNQCTSAECRLVCDKNLVSSLRALPPHPKNWPMPPRPGTERDSFDYSRNAIRYFE